MNRLTKHYPSGAVACNDINAVLKRLAEYEDAEENGFIIRSQCSLEERDVAPVVHARWISLARPHSAEDMYKCSACGFTEEPSYNWYYCPKCGAKMDEKETET